MGGLDRRWRAERVLRSDAPRRRHPWRALVGALLLLSLAGCGDGEPAQGAAAPAREREGRVFLIGIDGGSPRVAETLMEQGRLPTLSAIAREGVSGRIESMKPLLSPRIWTTVATGKAPVKHGIREFRTREDGKSRLYNSADRQVLALWNLAGAHGRTVGVVNWWVTQPAEVINGVMMSDHLIPAHLPGAAEVAGKAKSPDLAGTAVFPPSWAPRLIEAVRDPTFPVPFDDFLVGDEALPHWVARDELSVHLRTDAASTRCALLVQAELAPDILMVFLPGIDRVSHWLWGSMEPAERYPERLRPTGSERKAGVRALYHYYEYVDALIGRLTENAGPDDLVIVLSDHGFDGGRVRSRPLLTGRHNTDVALHGVFFARGPGIPAGGSSEGVSVKDVLPTVLAWLGWPLAFDLDGRVASFLDRDAVPQLQFVATYEDGRKIERLEGSESADETVLEQLRALGYFE